MTRLSILCKTIEKQFPRLSIGGGKFLKNEETVGEMTWHNKYNKGEQGTKSVWLQ